MFFFFHSIRSDNFSCTASNLFSTDNVVRAEIFRPQAGRLEAVYPELSLFEAPRQLAIGVVRGMWNSLSEPVDTNLYFRAGRKGGNKNRSSAESEYSQSAEHIKGARLSTRTKHERGLERKGRDQGNEKGDVRRKRYK